jgi:hypothetical protein
MALNFIARELQDFTEKKTAVQRVMMAVRARDSCIKKIEEISSRDFASGQNVTQEKLDSVRQFVLVTSKDRLTDQ